MERDQGGGKGFEGVGVGRGALLGGDAAGRTTLGGVDAAEARDGVAELGLRVVQLMLKVLNVALGELRLLGPAAVAAAFEEGGAAGLRSLQGAFGGGGLLVEEDACVRGCVEACAFGEIDAGELREDGPGLGAVEAVVLDVDERGVADGRDGEVLAELAQGRS